MARANKKDSTRGRINLSFDLSNVGEATVYDILKRLSKTKKASAYVANAILSTVNTTHVEETPHKSVEAPAQTPARPEEQKKADTESVVKAESIKEEGVIHISDNEFGFEEDPFSEDGIATALDIFGR